MADQIEVAEEALEQLSADVAAEAEIVLRFDSAGATHGLLDWAREGDIRFSVGFDLTEPVREAIARIPDERWVSALAQDGSPRENGEVCEATDLIDLSGDPTTHPASTATRRTGESHLVPTRWRLLADAW